MSLTDVHNYDGCLLLTKSYLSKDLDRISNINIQTKMKCIETIKTILSQKLGLTFTLQARRNLEQIISDLYREGYTNRGHNWDHTNKIHAIDLLYLCYELIEQLKNQDTDILELINIQLYEMSSGMCAQGRVYRILQVVVAMPLPWSG